jgi:hypothetical protein
MTTSIPLLLPHSVNPKVSEDQERFLLKALAKDPADRFSNLSTMLHALPGGFQSAEMQIEMPAKTMVFEDVETLQGNISNGLQQSMSEGRETILPALEDKKNAKKKSILFWTVVAVLLAAVMFLPLAAANGVRRQANLFQTRTVTALLAAAIASEQTAVVQSPRPLLSLC